MRPCPNPSCSGKECPRVVALSSGNGYVYCPACELHGPVGQNHLDHPIAVRLWDALPRENVSPSSTPTTLRGIGDEMRRARICQLTADSAQGVVHAQQDALPRREWPQTITPSASMLQNAIERIEKLENDVNVAHADNDAQNQQIGLVDIRGPAISERLNKLEAFIQGKRPTSPYGAVHHKLDAQDERLTALERRFDDHEYPGSPMEPKAMTHPEIEDRVVELERRFERMKRGESDGC